MTISPPRPGSDRAEEHGRRDGKPALPSAFALRRDMNGIREAPGKVWFWELAAAVIDADRCVQCGACIAACPTASLDIGKADLPQLVKMCTGCSLCWDFCPRGGLRYEATWMPEAAGADCPECAVAPAGRAEPEPAEASWCITGAHPRDIPDAVVDKVAARVRSDVRGAVEGQDGGVVSAILLSCLEAGEIDGAVVATEDPDQPWRGVPVLATTAEQIRSAAGSFYNQTMALAALDLDGSSLGESPRIALVGTPCEIQGLRALQSRRWRRGRAGVDRVVLSIALLCTKNFDYRKLLLGELRDARGIDISELGKLDVINGRLVALDRAGERLLDEPIKDFHGAALKGCDECADFLGRAADISVGSVGSEAGWSSVLVRTEAGRRAFACTLASLEVTELSRPAELERLDRLDKKIAGAALQRPLDPDGPLFVDFEEHVTFYGGTDRAPVWR